MSIGASAFSVPGKDTSFLQWVLDAVSYSLWEKACFAREFLSDTNFLHLCTRVLSHPVPEHQITTLAYHRD